MVDILVLGATGFTGRLVARYLHQHPQRRQSTSSNTTTHRPFTFAVAGRSPSKLNELVASLGFADDVEVIVVNTSNDEDVERALKRSKVVINCVGPFWKYSFGVVRACAANGIHYVDITGETPFVYEIIKRYDYLAYKNKSIIIPSCGFDSLPSDIIAFVSASALRKALAPRSSSEAVSEAPSALIASSKTSYKIKAAGPSGGTLATIISSLEDVPREAQMATRRVDCLSPVEHASAGGKGFSLVYSLVPFSSPRTVTSSLANVTTSSGRTSPFSSWGTFFLLASHNRATVMRSWGIFEREGAGSAHDSKADDAKNVTVKTYGPDFTYVEFMHAKGPIRATVASLVWVGFIVSIILLPPVRWLFKKVALQPGQGPSEEAMSKSWCLSTNITTSIPIQSDIHKEAKPCIVQSTMEIKSDIGYTGTAALVSESALALLDIPSLPPLAHHGGVLTPATALGHVIVHRLKEVDLVEVKTSVLQHPDD